MLSRQTRSGSIWGTTMNEQEPINDDFSPVEVSGLEQDGDGDGGGNSIVEEATDSEKSKAAAKKRKRYTPDDMGNADRLLDLYGTELRWADSFKNWLVWDGKRWAMDGHEAMRRAMDIPRKIVFDAGSRLIQDSDDKRARKLEDWGHKSGTSARLKAMLEVARSFPGVSVEADEINADRRLINCPNGTLVLDRTGSSFRGTLRSDLCTKITGPEFREGAVSVMWDNFLARFLPEPELRQWAQKVAGYSMLGGNPERRIVFCLGPTSSGKSTFAELVNAALGSYSGSFNLSMLRDNQDERARPDLVRAMDQRVIFASEASAFWKLHADMIKRATGQDNIVARLPHVGTPVEKVPMFTPWIISNSAPTIEGADKALYRRLCVVLFPHTIAQSEEDVSFRDDLIARGELGGVLAWLIQGYNLYCTEGLGDVPERITGAERKLREQLSDMDVFLAEKCSVGDGAKTVLVAVPSELYGAYEDWCEVNGVVGRDRYSGTAFGRALTDRGYPSRMVRGDDGKPVRRRTGIALK